MSSAQSGFDTETFPTAEVKSVLFVGTEGNDRFENTTSIPSFAFGNEGNDILIGGSGEDHLGGGEGDDQLIGNESSDLLVAGIGNDRIDGNAGDDKAYGTEGENIINLGDGDDLVYGGIGPDTIDGGNGNDELYANGGDDIVSGGSGNDIVSGHNGDDLLVGGDGNDKLYGGAGADEIVDLVGWNVLAGGAGDDDLTAGAGRDTLYGGDGEDILRGGGDHDTLAGQAGDDLIYGGDGNDKLFGNSGADELFGGAGSDRLLGLAGNDVLFGGGGSDSLYGGDDHDDLYGEGGSDKLFGEEGLDGLFGGVGGRDLLEGGLGRDRFLRHSGDVVTDLFANAEVELLFKNSSSYWTDKEISVLDAGFGKLHRTTGDTRVLRNTLDANELTFFKVTNTSTGNPAQNELQMTYLRSGETGILIPGSEEYTRKISFADWDESDIYQNEFRTRAAIHEIAHNFDSAKEIDSVIPGTSRLWNLFIAQSGWRTTNPNSASFAKSRGTSFEPFDIQFDPSINNYRQTPTSWWYRTSTDFARDYGKTNPQEDWATTWEAAFVETPNPDINIVAKLSVVNRFLAAI